MMFEVGDDFSKILFGDDISREIVPRGSLGTISPVDDLCRGRFPQHSSYCIKAEKSDLFLDLRGPLNPWFYIVRKNFIIYNLYCPQLPSRCVLCPRVIKHKSRREPTSFA